MMAEMNLKKGFLSLFVLYHLMVVVVTPNKETYFGQLVAPIVEPYINFFELASSWNFFAPDPGPPPLYLEWELLGKSNAIIGTGAFPEKADPFWIRERQNRRIALARFLFYSDERHLKVWGDYLCRSNAEIEGVRLWKNLHSIPNLFDVQKGVRRIGDEEGSQRTSVGTHFCHRPEALSVPGASS